MLVCFDINCFYAKGEQGIEFSETGKGEHHAVSQTRKDQRSNSRPFHTTDTDLQMTRDSADANGKAALTLSLDSGSRVAQLRELETESQVTITLLVFVLFCFVFAPSICHPLALCGGCRHNVIRLSECASLVTRQVRIACI